MKRCLHRGEPDVDVAACTASYPETQAQTPLRLGIDIAHALPMSRWAQFVSELTKDMGVWLFFVLWSAILRMVFIMVFEPSALGYSILLVLMHGLRFDAQVATFCIVPLLLMNLWSLLHPLHDSTRRTWRRLTGLAYTLLTSILMAAMLLYYTEFDEAFGTRIFDLWLDDTFAILFVVLSDPLSVLCLLAGVGVGILGGLLFRCWRRVIIPGPQHAYIQSCSVVVRALYVACFIALLVVAGRGSITARPAMRKWTAITSSDVLNDAVMNPLSHMRYALRDFVKQWHAHWNRKDNPYWAVEELPKAYAAVAKNVGAPLERKTSGNPQAPQHIFLVVMESYDIWPLLSGYEGLGVSTELSRIRSEGAWFPNFAAQSAQTIDSFVSILLGLAHVGRPDSVRRRTIITSLPEQLRTLGYRTRMFYGGMLSWQRLSTLCKQQGFDEVYGAGHMGASLNPSSWGLDDDVLFDFVAKQFPDDGDTQNKTFNVIVTLSYHPPYDLPAEKKAYRPPQVLPPHTRWAQGFSPEVLAHLYFADQQLGKFYDRTRAALPGSLFVFTGDHYGRRFPHNGPSAYERESVVLLMAGQGISGPRVYNVPGSHLDIAATLIELAADSAGVPYRAIGRNLLAGDTVPDGVALGVDTVFTWKGVAKVVGEQNFVGRTVRVGEPLPVVTPRATDWKRWRTLRNQIHAVSYDLLAE